MPNFFLFLNRNLEFFCIYSRSRDFKYGEPKPGPVKERKIFIADVKIGSEQATYQDMVTRDDSSKK
ncbi:hypothetical protein CN326_02490 [Bacillus sp. AFS018417]|nr:hypothetical protein CN326_02490 [Bacillus sp. AFS018417]